MPGTPPEVRAERGFEDEVVHTQRTTRAERDMIERMQRQASVGTASSSPSTPQEVRAEKEFANEVVHAQQTTRAERDMIERMQRQASARSSKCSTVDAASAPSTPQEVRAERGFENEVVHVQRTTRAEREMIERMQKACAPQRGSEPGGDDDGFEALLCKAASSSPSRQFTKAMRVQVTPAEDRLHGEPDRLDTPTRPAVRDPPSSPSDEILASPFSSPTGPTQRGDGYPADAADFLDLRAWEMERELVRRPDKLREVCRALYYYHDSDVMRMVSGITNLVAEDTAERGATAARKVNVTRGKDGIVIEGRGAAAAAAASPKKKPASSEGGKALVPHAVAVKTFENEQRMKRLREVFARVDARNEGRVAVQKLSETIDNDPTVRRLLCTCYGASPTFARKLQQRLKASEGATVSLAQLETLARALLASQKPV